MSIQADATKEECDELLGGSSSSTNANAADALECGTPLGKASPPPSLGTDSKLPRSRRGSASRPNPYLGELPPVVRNPLEKLQRLAADKGFGWLFEVAALPRPRDDSGPRGGGGGVASANPAQAGCVDAIMGTLRDDLDIRTDDMALWLKYVLLPGALPAGMQQRPPDFWGPLLVTCFYAMLLCWSNTGVVFWLVVTWFLGSFVIFFLTRVLGGEVSYSYVLATTGYTMLPLCVTVLLLDFVLGSVWLVAFLVKVLGVLWASSGAASLLVTRKLANRRILLLYPILLFNIYLMSLHSGA